VVLQVHHKRYLRGRRLWEYPLELCQTICSGCHARIHGLIPPSTGWDHVGWDDLGDLDGECELCGQAIRYVFLVDHPDWKPMEVGEQCCDKLTTTDEASMAMRARRLLADRRRRFIESPWWRTDERGVSRLVHKRHVIDIVRDGASWRIWVDGTRGRQQFASTDHARSCVFEVIESGWLESRGARRQADRGSYGARA
jgi:hypothetical protein